LTLSRFAGLGRAVDGDRGAGRRGDDADFAHQAGFERRQAGLGVVGLFVAERAMPDGQQLVVRCDRVVGFALAVDGLGGQ